jgi:hypothetical protein
MLLVKPVFHGEDAMVVVYVGVHRDSVGGVDNAVGREGRELL